MKKKIYYRLASLMLAVLCAFVSMPTGGLSGILTVYAEETTEEPTQEVDDVYFDAVNGVSYYYYGYSDGTAKIYNVTFSSGAVLDFPVTVNAYTVTQIALTDIGTYENRANVSVLTLPENITYIEDESFQYFDIGTLNYNTNAENGTYITGSIFNKSTISNLTFGENVVFIDDWTFDNAIFLFSELTVSAKTIGIAAFRGVWSESNPGILTLADTVETFDYNAFASNYFATVNYNCSATSDEISGEYGIFLNSTINALNIGANVTKIGRYMFYETCLPFTEFTLSVPSIEQGAFAKCWTDGRKCNLTLTENVTYIEDTAFMLNDFTAVNYNCNAATKDEYGMSGLFYHSNVDSLVIAPTVTTIPNYAFNEAYLNFNTLTLDVERIGKYAFGYLWAEQEAGTLTLTERVNYICPTAFGYGNYVKVNYNANADGESTYDSETIFYTLRMARGKLNRRGR